MSVQAIIFDIDGTLTREIAWPHLTRRAGGSVEDNDAAFASYTRGEISELMLKQKLIENWSRGGCANKRDFQTFLDEIALREDARGTLAYLKQKYEVCLITGSFDVYAEIIAEKLGVSDWYANTHFGWDSEGVLVDVSVIVDDSTRKIEQLREYCEAKGFTPSECVAVGDSANDIGIFKATGRGIAVRTEYEAKELEAAAWKVVDELAELKTLL